MPTYSRATTTRSARSVRRNRQFSRISGMRMKARRRMAPIGTVHEHETGSSRVQAPITRTQLRRPSSAGKNTRVLLGCGDAWSWGLLKKRAAGPRL